MSIKHFWDWRVSRLLKEVSELFDRDGFNQLFRNEIQRLNQRFNFDPQELERLMRFDFVGYADRAVRNLGVPESDLDGHVHDMLVRMAVTGGLFRNYNGQPFLARFVTSVKNSTINLGKKLKTRQKRTSGTPIEDYELPHSPQKGPELVERFRSYVSAVFGSVALRVLDHRLDGGDTKDLKGEQGLESSYRIKQTVKQLKKAAQDFAVRENEPELLRLVLAGFEAEERTLTKRFVRS